MFSLKINISYKKNIFLKLWTNGFFWWKSTFWRWILLVWHIVRVKRFIREQKINVIFLCFWISYFLLCVYLSMQILFWLAQFAKIQVFAGKDFIMYPMTTNGRFTLSLCTEKITIFIPHICTYMDTGAVWNIHEGRKKCYNQPAATGKHNQDQSWLNPN